jgi:hypothetical protein
MRNLEKCYELQVFVYELQKKCNIRFLGSCFLGEKGTQNGITVIYLPPQKRNYCLKNIHLNTSFQVICFPYIKIPIR